MKIIENKYDVHLQFIQMDFEYMIHYLKNDFKGPAC